MYSPYSNLMDEGTCKSGSQLLTSGGWHIFSIHRDPSMNRKSLPLRCTHNNAGAFTTIVHMAHTDRAVQSNRKSSHRQPALLPLNIWWVWHESPSSHHPSIHPRWIAPQHVFESASNKSPCFRKAILNGQVWTSITWAEKKRNAPSRAHRAKRHTRRC